MKLELEFILSSEDFIINFKNTYLFFLLGFRVSLYVHFYYSQFPVLEIQMIN